MATPEEEAAERTLDSFMDIWRPIVAARAGSGPHHLSDDSVAIVAATLFLARAVQSLRN
jgi:hypothetical protein